MFFFLVTSWLALKKGFAETKDGWGGSPLVKVSHSKIILLKLNKIKKLLKMFYKPLNVLCNSWLYFPAVSCDPPTANANSEYSPIKDNYGYNQQVHYICKDDLALIGSPVSTCIETGFDTEPPTCIGELLFFKKVSLYLSFVFCLF